MNLPNSRFLSEKLSVVFKTDLIEYFIAFDNQELGDIIIDMRKSVYKLEY